ncbi:hypothetical protein Poli38472_004544 [Pythium oligandrum]|uniref:Uncharacterized protein n=1 Tax=Pythium oligandrum TaxID=41045 RepID=A0A8K1FDJ0_PYTOL|nr:hypothetical protein Poli38472_004544 [Pythium oligandrum]|eukprot:TMW59475.1 hypothetical protein Poli38472_004544 [Pythium oligandrum]
MLRRKPTRVEDRADVAEEYELYVREKKKRLQEERQKKGLGLSGGDAAAWSAMQQRKQVDAVRQQTRSRIGLGAPY